MFCADNVATLVLGTAAGLVAVWIGIWWVRRIQRSHRLSEDKLVVQRVMGCFEYSDVDEGMELLSEDEFWSEYQDPRATLNGLKHSAEFQAHARSRNMDIDHEEEKLLVYQSLRRYDPDAFGRLLDGCPDDYKEYSAAFLPPMVAMLDYLFLCMGIPLARGGFFLYFSAWVAIELCMLSSQSTLFSIGLQSKKGYYVVNEHNHLAGPLRIMCALALEMIWIYYTRFLGVALSLAMKLVMKKRQGVMEYAAGIWMILETKKQAQIR